MIDADADPLSKLRKRAKKTTYKDEKFFMTDEPSDKYTEDGYVFFLSLVTPDGSFQLVNNLSVSLFRFKRA